MLDPFLNNLMPWALQVLVLGSIGAFLPVLFRIRHPRSQLIYYQMVLVTCLVLPVVQPWQHPVVAVSSGQIVPEGPAISFAVAKVQSAPAPVAWGIILPWIFAAGFAVRSCWTLAGLWQLRRLRRIARPLYPVPESIVDACSRTKAGAAFCTATGDAGPVTFGFLRPVILLPESFLALDKSAQLGIACHELLHVRRNDWRNTVIEEFLSAVFWFHPGVWWMLGQARLAREQLVDAEVVRLTAAREPYIDALLAIAGVRPRLDLVPAPLFLRRRHLLQRMHSLVTEVSMSKIRLYCSYVSIAAIIAVAGWAVFVSFPLVAQAEIAAAPAQTPRAPETPPGYVVNRPPISYPTEALRKRIEGMVVVELTFNVRGEIIDSRVLSGPDELRRAGLESALRGSYNIDVARTLQVVVDFKLPPGGVVGGVRGGATDFAPGFARGARGQVAPLGSPPPPPFTLNNPVDSIEIRGLNEPALTQMRQRLQVFLGRPLSSPDLLKEITEAAQTSGLTSLPMFPNVSIADGKTTLAITFGQRVRVGGNVAAANLLEKVKPVYPPLAKAARIQGVVVLEAGINKEGKVDSLTVVTGHPLLIEAAMDAAKQWVYRPILLNGQAVDLVTTITVNFAFSEQ
ncbi:MAG: TonB family protein [Acidobacteria bacterium]|nr:TonB family protein [Acidobacteriota bacterium]